MHVSRIAGMAAAAVVTVTSAALAQTSTPPTQPPTQTQTQPQTQPQTTPQIAQATEVQTFTGCLMKESDYRRAHNLGDGAVGGLGLGDEFVLTDVKVSAATAPAGMTGTSSISGARTSTPASVAASTTTSTCADQGVAYRVTGSEEEQLKTLVGRHVAVIGRMKNAADAAAGAARTDDKLPPEVEMISFSEAPSPSPVTPAAATPPPPPPPPTLTTPPPTTPPPTQPADPVAGRTELPRTAGATGLLALVGALALISGVALSVMRRRAL